MGIVKLPLLFAFVKYFFLFVIFLLYPINEEEIELRDRRIYLEYLEKVLFISKKSFIDGSIYLRTFELLCAIWYRLYNLKLWEKHLWRNVTFSKFAGFIASTLLKVTLPHVFFFWRFLNRANDTKWPMHGFC